MLICERCGNEYHRKPITNKEGNKVTFCPFCRNENIYTPPRGKKNRNR